MNTYEIILLPGDGVGSELTEAARQALEAAGRAEGFAVRFQTLPFGGASYRATGKAIPDDTMEALERCGCALLGALDVRDIPSPSPMGTLRRRLKLYADVRPARAYPGRWSLRPNLNIVCIRENTQGFLADRNLEWGYGEFCPTNDQVLSLRVVTRDACEQIARFAFEYARQNGRRKITALHKANVLKKGCGLFLESFRRVAAQYPDIAAEDEYVDGAVGGLICRPERYDILLTTNLFGDLVSDEVSALVSGMTPTANYGEGRALFMPMNHQPSYELVGRDQVDPLSMMLCCGMLLDYLGERTAAERLRTGIASVAALQPSPVGTAAMVKAVCAGI